MNYKKGKNFSGNNCSGKRKKSDFYETPYTLTRHLLNVEDFDYSFTICEPACGDGAIVKILNEKTNNVVAYDIQKNFLTETEQYEYIISNPPFSIAYEFILKAKQRSYFIMEMPVYRVPQLKTVFITMYTKVKVFLFDAGKIIIAVSIVLWLMSAYGPGNSFEQIEKKYTSEIFANPTKKDGLTARQESEKLEASYVGHIGKFIEPAIKPLGFD